MSPKQIAFCLGDYFRGVPVWYLVGRLRRPELHFAWNINFQNDGGQVGCNEKCPLELGTIILGYPKIGVRNKLGYPKIYLAGFGARCNKKCDCRKLKSQNRHFAKRDSPLKVNR